MEDGHRVYELYTSATGFYICLLIARAIAMFAGWLRQVNRAIDTIPFAGWPIQVDRASGLFTICR